MENIKTNRCKYCMCEIPEGYFCCRSYFEDFEDFDYGEDEDEE